MGRDLVWDNFWPIYARAILEIPLVQDRDGFVAWPNSKTAGIFLVRSMYILGWVESQVWTIKQWWWCEQFSVSSVWEKLWKSHVPAKIKKFRCRTLHNVIPCLGTPAKWHINTTGQCPLCPLGFEDLNHMFFMCTRAKEIWKKLGLDDHVSRALSRTREGVAVLEELL